MVPCILLSFLTRTTEVRASNTRPASAEEGSLCVLGGPLKERWLYAQPRDEERLVHESLVLTSPRWTKPPSPELAKHEGHCRFCKSGKHEKHYWNIENVIKLMSFVTTFLICSLCFPIVSPRLQNLEFSFGKFGARRLGAPREMSTFASIEDMWVF